MAVDTPTPVPDELDARVEQMLQHMDRVHAEVVNRLEPSADEGVSGSVSPVSRLDAEVDRALQDAAEAAKVASEPSAPTPPPPAPPPAAESNGDGVPTAAIKELDEKLASTAVKAIDDEFADGSEMVEGQSLDVPLPDSKPLGELPPVAAPVAVAAAPVVEAVAPTPAVQPAPAPAPAPVPAAPAPAPAPAPAAKPAPAPTPAPVKAATPAVIVPVPPKPAGPTMADRFWTVATPVMEPIAVRLGKLPVGFQHTVGWIGIVTLFMAAATWGYVLFFQETRPASHILEQESKEHAEAGHGDAHGEKPSGGHAAKAPDAEAKKPASSNGHAPESPQGDAHADGAGHEKPKAPEHGGH